jgi:hypothetical protein
MDAQYPEGCSAMDLPIYDPPGSFWITPPYAPEAKCVGHPPVLAAQFSHVITTWGQKALVKAWDALHHPSLNVRQYTSTHESNRSSTSAYHFGIWQVQQPYAMVTRETCLQGTAELRVIDNLLLAVKCHIALKINALLFQYTPQLLEHQWRCILL